MYNSSLLISPAGELAACYRKILLFDADLPWAEPGDTRFILNTEIGRIAPGICMDLMTTDSQHLRRRTTRRSSPLHNWLEEGLDVWSYWKFRLAELRRDFHRGQQLGLRRNDRVCGRSAIFGHGMELLASAGKEGNEIFTRRYGTIPQQTDRTDDLHMHPSRISDSCLTSRIFFAIIANRIVQN